MIGLFPILQNHVFDMASSGKEFKLWIPPKDQFIVGDNDGARPSAEPVGNLRPQVIYDALLLRAVDRQNELAVLEGGEHEVIDPGGKWRCSPTIHSTSLNRTVEGGIYRARLCLTEPICGRASRSFMTNTGLSSPTFGMTNIGNSMGCFSQRIYRSGDHRRNTPSSLK